MSPILSNAALEHAMCKWKKRLVGKGFALDENKTSPRLTNIRYADDLLLFAQSEQELIIIIETLVEVLQEYGLELNTSKTKILSRKGVATDPGSRFKSDRACASAVCTRTRNNYNGSHRIKCFAFI